MSQELSGMFNLFFFFFHRTQLISSYKVQIASCVLYYVALDLMCDIVTNLDLFPGPVKITTRIASGPRAVG